MSTTEAIQEADRRGYHCDERGNIYGPKGDNPLSTDRHNQYSAFSLRTDGQVVTIPVHRFIAFQLHGEVIFQSGVEVRHLDNDRTNNSWQNIGFGTSSQNKYDIPKQERISRARHAANVRWGKVA